MGDPRTYETETVSYDECDICEHPNPTTYWENSLTRKWSREAYDCRQCGEHHSEIHGDDYDRGSSTVKVAFIAAGLALLTIGAIGALAGNWPQGLLMLSGLCFIGAPYARKDPTP